MCEELVAANTFSLAKYISENALSKVRLYLTSKPLKQEDELTESANSNGLFLSDFTGIKDTTTTSSRELQVHVPVSPMHALEDILEFPEIILEEDTIL